MAQRALPPKRAQRPAAVDAAPRHRSGAVARMVHMPVATLRVWERRYGLTQAALSPSGHRLYSPDEVRRVALLKQLTELGHAIGSLAALDMAQLLAVAATHARALAPARPGERSRAAACRVAVIGAALALRLRRPAVLRRLGRPLELLGPFTDVQQAAAALQGAAVDALIVHQPSLQVGWRAALDAQAPALAAVPKAILYGFAAESVCEALAMAGVALLREPQTDTVLAQWLHNMLAAVPAVRPAAPGRALASLAVPPRRWDDAALADFAGLSSTIACECPRHVAELLVQLSHFEAYSADCQNRSPADAELHAYLRQVAATSRAHFEAALEHVALHEGLILPA
jgi:MerR family transcriptional regulator, light-induced transcriptional regulator